MSTDGKLAALAAALVFSNMLLCGCTSSHAQTATNASAAPSMPVARFTARAGSLAALPAKTATHRVVREAAVAEPRETPTIVPVHEIAAPATLAPHPRLALTARPVTTDAPAVRAPHDLPKILRIGLASHVIRSGQTVHAEVFTTTNVASVEARLASYGFNLTRVGVGHFAFQYRVPDVPFYLKRDWPVDIIARNVDGRQATREITIVVQ